MRYGSLLVLICVGGALAQFPGAPSPWNSPASRPSLGKPGRPSLSPFGGSSSNSKQSLSYSSASYDDPIPANSRLESTYDTQQLPAKLPILAPNGVVEIYNRVVDDLLKRLETDFKRREIDPMEVVIRPTPAGPVRVPGHLQKRPFRRPGAALYRAGLPVVPPKVPKPFAKSPSKRKSRSPDELPPSVRFPDERPVASSGENTARDAGQGPDVKPSFRGAGKISKGPLNEDDEKDALLPETTTPVITTTLASQLAQNKTTEAPSEEPSSTTPVEDESSEEDEEVSLFTRARSDEYVSNEQEPDLDLEHDGNETEPGSPVVEKDRKDVTKPEKKNSKKDGTDEEEDDEDQKDKNEGSKDVETLLQKYQNKNTNNEKAGTKQKYTAPPKDLAAKKKEDEKLKSKIKNNSKEKKTSKEEDDDEDDDFSDTSDGDDDDEIRYHDDVGIEPGTLQSGGNRPNGGFYPPGGPPALPAKPNAQLTGLSKIRRASDVSVSVDARSAVITARLLVGPLHVVVNDSVEPLERNVRATIPELEAELLLMERHGVVFLQRFTLDRAYGQDVEISIPKNKEHKKKPVDQMQAGAQQRYQTKMAAHISMEVVKLLRSGNLRVNLMRTAQSSMSKLKLPIQKPKKSKKKSKKGDKNKNNENSE